MVKYFRKENVMAEMTRNEVLQGLVEDCLRSVDRCDLDLRATFSLGTPARIEIIQFELGLLRLKLGNLRTGLGLPPVEKPISDKDWDEVGEGDDLERSGGAGRVV
jgi:hypothetical protein